MESSREISKSPVQIQNVEKPRTSIGHSFSETLESFYSQVNDQINEANQKTEEFATGKHHDLHEIMIATEKASISFRLLLQIRNKLLEGYQEIMRMQF
jgi:flagellar hook-basal body complex protein FliE